MTKQNPSDLFRVLCRLCDKKGSWQFSVSHRRDQSYHFKVSGVGDLSHEELQELERGAK